MSVSADREFSIRIRSQGVFSVFLLAEDSHIRCKSSILDIPLLKSYARMKEEAKGLSVEGERSSLHLWSPQLSITNTSCFITCSISEPAEVYFEIEEESSSPRDSSKARSPTSIRQRGYYGGRFAEEARFFVGTLGNEGHYNIWITLQSNNLLSDVYYYNFIIPSRNCKSYQQSSCRMRLRWICVSSSEWRSRYWRLTSFCGNHIQSVSSDFSNSGRTTR